MNPDDLAKQRFLMLSAVRLLGAALVVAGLLILAGRIDMPRPAGMAFTGFGMLEFFLLPLFLARQWRTPPR